MEQIHRRSWHLRPRSQQSFWDSCCTMRTDAPYAYTAQCPMMMSFLSLPRRYNARMGLFEFWEDMGIPRIPLSDERLPKAGLAVGTLEHPWS